MQSQVLLRSVQDLSTMDKGEVSKNLFGQIAWEEILRSGVFLEHKDVSSFAILLNYNLCNSLISIVILSF